MPQCSCELYPPRYYRSCHFRNSSLYKEIGMIIAYCSVIINGASKALEIFNNVSTLGLVKPASVLPIVDFGTLAKSASSCSDMFIFWRLALICAAMYPSS